MNDQNAMVPFTNAAVPEAIGQDGYFEESESPRTDFGEIRAGLFRQRWVILAFLLLGILAGAVVTFLVPRSYSATSIVQFQNVPQLLEAQKAVDPSLNDRDFERQINAQEAVVTSRDLARRVANALRLAEEPAFLGAVGLDAGANTEQVVEELRRHVAANNPWGTEALEISFASADPRISARLANAYAENLITANIERKYETSSYAREFLAGRLEEARQELDDSEREAQEYARGAGIVQTSGVENAGPTSLSAASLMQMNADLAAARTTRIQAEQRWRQASATPLMSLPEVQSNGAIQGLLSRRAELGAELARLRQEFRDDYPAVARLQSQISQIDQEVQTLATQVRNSIQDRYLTAARQESSLAARIGGLRAETLQDQARIDQLERINREAAGDRSLYDNLLSRFQEVSTAAGITTNNMVIVEQATPPGSPTTPNPPLYLAIAAAAGLALGIIAAFIREFRQDPVRSPDDVLQKLGMPLLGTTPAARAPGAAYEELVYSNSPLSEAYHSVRCALEYAPGQPPRSILVTSSRPGEGKSTTAIALAADFASHGMKVLLIDADLRRPGLHKLVGGHNDVGFADVLGEEAALEDAVQRFENIDFLSGGSASKNPTEILSPGRVARFITLNTSLYDVMVLDGPPVMGMADAPQMARSVAGTMLVVEAGRVQRAHVQTALRRLRAVQATILGIVLTKFDATAAGYGTRYGDTYDYNYGAAANEPRLLGGQ
jgi:polysaccharide biosynthesis transport protein